MYGAATMLLFYISSLRQSYEIVRFSMGSLDIVGFDYIYYILLSLLITIFVIYRYQKSLEFMSISDDFALLKGINIQRDRYIILLLVSISISILVSITGPIGFVGLIIPHIVQSIYKQNSSKLLFYNLIFGGVFLVWCDLISRVISTSSTLPIGVITSFIGAIFFIYLLIKNSTKSS
jgi:iron complex transport system permease protein